MLSNETVDPTNTNLLLDILKKEYGLKNIFFVISSTFLIGLCRTLFRNEIIKNLTIFYSLITCLCCIFVIGVYPFVKKIIKEVGFIIWPSFKEIIIQIIKVVVFVIILICMIFVFKHLYSEIIDPLKKI